jgi:ABC-type uncharacterized transport system auxiliary subunit
MRMSGAFRKIFYILSARLAPAEQSKAGGILVGLLIVFASLSACTILPKSPVRVSYILEMPTVQQSPQLPISIYIPDLSSTSYLQSRSIFFSNHPYSRLPYQSAVWGEDLPDALTRLLRSYLRVNGSTQQVVTSVGMGSPTHMLTSSLEEAYVKGTGSETGIVLIIQRELFALPSRELIASDRFERLLPIDARDLNAVIAGFQTSVAFFLEDTTKWIQSVLSTQATSTRARA